MREYIIMIVSAALLSSFAEIVSPDNWRKYIKIVTGLIVLAVIITPILNLRDIDLLSSFAVSEQMQEMEEENQRETIKEELKKRVEQDIKDRVESEFSKVVEAEVEIGVNSSDEIVGVDKIYVYSDTSIGGLQRRLAEVYGVDEREVLIGYE